MRFAAGQEDMTASPQTGLLGLDVGKADILGLGQSAILAVVVLLALVFVLRPMAIRLSAVTPQNMLGGGELLLAGPAGGTYAGAAITPATRMIAGSGAAMLADESMVDMMNVEGQLRASSIRKLAEMVEKHPEESLSIMRGWMTQERS